MRCANCEREAQYLFAPGTCAPIYFCEPDLPDHLRPLAASGRLDIPEDPSERPPSIAQVRARNA